jgi:hypothetical protein
VGAQQAPEYVPKNKAAPVVMTGAALRSSVRLPPGHGERGLALRGSLAPAEPDAPDDGLDDGDGDAVPPDGVVPPCV